MLADWKENTARAFVRQGLQHRGCVDRPRAIIEGQHHFLVAQEIELLEVLETEPRSARGIDFHHATDTECIRIGATCFCWRWSYGSESGYRSCGSGCACSSENLWRGSR